MRALRRQYVFEDESGEAWTRVGTRCFVLLREAVTAAVGASTTATGGTAAPKRGGASGATPGHTARWNTVPLSVKVRVTVNGMMSTDASMLHACARILRGGTHVTPCTCHPFFFPTSMQRTSPHQAVGAGLTADQATHLWWLLSHSYDVRLAAESLAALVAASRREDVYGALRLTQPSLGSVVAALASLQLALQQLLRWSYSVPDRQLLLAVGQPRSEGLAQGLLSGQAVDPHALALHDAVSQALSGACGALGAGVVDAVQDDAGVVLHGSVAEVVGAVRGALAGRR